MDLHSGSRPRRNLLVTRFEDRPNYDAGGNEITVGAASYAYTPRNLLASGDGLSYGVYRAFKPRLTVYFQNAESHIA